jgi:hypothetical protein
VTTLHNKVVLFGLLGAAGCLAGWALGEAFLFAAVPSGPPQQGSLLTRPEPPEDFKKRLEKAGAKTGDVQISLLWNNINDLDLLCIEPSGEVICFVQRKAASGGELDVDRNASGTHFTDTPIENIYWPPDRAPLGKYKVYVNHFQNQGGSDPTAYRVNILAGGRRKEYNNSISSIGLPGVLAVLKQGRGPVVEKNIPQIEAFLTLLGQRGQPAGLASPHLVCEFVVGGQSPWLMVLGIGVWTALLAVGLSLALVAGQNWSLGRPLLSTRQGLVLTASGAAAGLVAGGLGQALLVLLTLAHLVPQIGFVFGWILLGTLLGRGVGLFVPNLNGVRASLAGAVGGLLGALAFLVVSLLADVAGRFVGATILGGAIGLMVALVEMAFRKAWLEIIYGPHEVGTVNLGEVPVSIGSDGRACTVLARGAAPVAFRYRLSQGQVLCQDAVNGQTTPVPLGHRRKVGPLELIVRGSAVLLATAVERTPASPAVAAPLVSRDSPHPAVAPVPERQEDAAILPERPAAPPVTTPARPAATGDGCPGCGRPVPGQRGQRYCIVCDRTF